MRDEPKIVSPERSTYGVIRPPIETEQAATRDRPKPLVSRSPAEGWFVFWFFFYTSNESARDYNCRGRNGLFFSGLRPYFSVTDLSRHTSYDTCTGLVTAVNTIKPRTQRGGTWRIRSPVGFFRLLVHKYPVNSKSAVIDFFWKCTAIPPPFHKSRVVANTVRAKRVSHRQRVEWLIFVRLRVY